jgi:Domain of unknown function (DUF4430)
LLARRNATGLGWEGGGGESPESEDLPPAATIVPLVEGGNVLHRSLSAFAAAAAILVLALSGCGSGSNSDTLPAAGTGGTTTTASDQAAVLVTKSCGRTVLVAKTDVPPSGTAMQGLLRVAKLKTSYGGKFVDAIDGFGPAAKNDSWLFYLNGKLSQKGATEIKLAPGDVEWWDLHDYKKSCQVPADAR